MVVFIVCSQCLLYSENSNLAVYSDTNSQIEVSVNQEFIIEADTKPMANYEWQFAKPIDQDILNLTKTEYNPVSGDSGKTLFYFQTKGQGMAMISLKYARSGEKDMYPLDSKTFIVNVK
jgi:predicted secreted protein